MIEPSTRFLHIATGPSVHPHLPPLNRPRTAPRSRRTFINLPLASTATSRRRQYPNLWPRAQLFAAHSQYTTSVPAAYLVSPYVRIFTPHHQRGFPGSPVPGRRLHVGAIGPHGPYHPISHREPPRPPPRHRGRPSHGRRLRPRRPLGQRPRSSVPASNSPRAPRSTCPRSSAGTPPAGTSTSTRSPSRPPSPSCRQAPPARISPTP